MKIKNSSSIIGNISGDLKLNFYEKVYWLTVCIFNFFLSLFYKIDKRIEIIEFQKFSNSKLLEKNLTPSRTLSDIFWLSFPWKKVKKILGEKYKIIEIGCGKGKYAKLLNSIIKGNLKNYLGIDIKKQEIWNKKFKNVNYKVSDCYKVGKYLKNNNFIVTQSAIEHFKFDIKFFRNIEKKLINKKKIVQVHLMPTYSCFFTYLFHGYRHYNLNSISKITSVFKGNVKIKLFKLGSGKLNLFHFKNITFYRKENSSKQYVDKKYFNKVKNLILEHNKSKKTLFPCFYALVIFHNIDKEIKF